jgi:hypothetical protein
MNLFDWALVQDDVDLFLKIASQQYPEAGINILQQAREEIDRMLARGIFPRDAKLESFDMVGIWPDQYMFSYGVDDSGARFVMLFT